MKESLDKKLLDVITATLIDPGLLDPETFDLISELIAGMNDTYHGDNVNRSSYLSLDIRNIYELIFKSIAPIEKIKKRPWYPKEERSEKGPTSVDRLLYVVSKSFNPSLVVSEEDLKKITRLLARMDRYVKKTNAYIHISEKTFNHDRSTFDKIFEQYFHSMIKLLNMIPLLSSDVDENIIKIQKKLLQENENEIITRISIGYPCVEWVRFDDISIDRIDEKIIDFKAQGFVEAGLRLGGKDGVVIKNDFSIKITYSFNIEFGDISEIKINEISEQSWNE